MNTEFENMALLNIEDYNELKAKMESWAYLDDLLP